MFDAFLQFDVDLDDDCDHKLDFINMKVGLEAS